MICDTSGLLAVLWSDQPESELCRAAMAAAGQLVISPLVLTEVDYLIASRVGAAAAARARRLLVSGAFDVAHLDRTDLQSATEVAGHYRDLGIGLVDASLVVLAKRYQTNQILTLDHRHFRAIRSLEGRHFTLLPFDMD